MHPIIEQEMVRQQQAGLERDEWRQELIAEARALRESASRGSATNGGGARPEADHEPALHHMMALILHPRTPHDPAH